MDEKFHNIVRTSKADIRLGFTENQIIKNVRSRLKVGDSIMVYDTIVRMKIPYVVEGFYPHHVLFRDIDYNLTSSFAYIDVLSALDNNKLNDGRTNLGVQRYASLNFSNTLDFK